MIGVFKMSENLIYNAIRTPDGTVLESTHRHDYVTHTDTLTGREYMVDGGLDYSRMTVHEDQICLHLYDDEPHEVQREVLKWGTRGPNGDKPVEYKQIKDLGTDHIKNILRDCSKYMSGVHKVCMERELLSRILED